MRLNSTELHALRSILGALDPAGQIYLYGSRTDDLRRGGDIDVYLQASSPIDLKTQLSTQYRLELACDTHVDLLVKNPGQPVQPIHKIAIEQGILLWQKSNLSCSPALKPVGNEQKNCAIQ